MKTLTLYWKRLLSKTPAALRKIQILLGALLAPVSAGLAVVNQTEQPLLYKVLQNAVITLPIVIAFLQFATTSKELQEMDNNDNIEKN